MHTRTKLLAMVRDLKALNQGYESEAKEAYEARDALRARLDIAHFQLEKERRFSGRVVRENMMYKWYLELAHAAATRSKSEVTQASRVDQNAAVSGVSNGGNQRSGAPQITIGGVRQEIRGDWRKTL